MAERKRSLVKRSSNGQSNLALRFPPRSSVYPVVVAVLRTTENSKEPGGIRNLECRIISSVVAASKAAGLDTRAAESPSDNFVFLE